MLLALADHNLETEQEVICLNCLRESQIRHWGKSFLAVKKNKP